MRKEFYGLCAPALSRRQFLTCAALASLGPVVPAGGAARELAAAVPQFLERYAATTETPWATVHAIRALGRRCRLQGEAAIAYVLRTCVRTETVQQRRCLYIPTQLEGHPNMFLKTFLEAGVPLTERFTLDDRSYQLQDLGEGAKALFRFEPSSFDPHELAWSLIAFAELQAHTWDNAYGQRIRLTEVARAGVHVLQEATAELTAYAAAQRPLPQKLPIHGYACGGTHLVYSLLVAAKHGVLPEDGGAFVQAQLQLLLFRLQADPDLIERYYRAIASAPGVELYRVGVKLKLLGHALECLGYAQRHGLWQPRPPERTQLEQAKQAVRDLLAYVVCLDLGALYPQ